jgi:hypothetical protein
MSMGRCVRCGRESDIEYGSDGQAYCSSCVFYGVNKQCYRCRMYIPATELQQYKGQWMCPYCLNDMRDEERRQDERGSAAEKKSEGYTSGETCDRCGRTLTTVYYYGGRRLCSNCFDDARREWKDVGGERPPMPMYRVTEQAAGEKGKMGFIESLFAELLGRLGIKVRRKKAESEIVAVERPAKEREKSGRGEGGGESGEEGPGPAPMIEGPESKEKKRKGRRSASVSFPEQPSAQEKKAAGVKKKKKGNWFEGFKED